MKNPKILIVDDISDNLKTIISLLEKSNPEYRLYQAINGADALEITNDINIDLIITDWDMPQINGIQLIKRLKADPKKKDIPVIMATGIMLTSDDLKIALKAGAVDYIRKPIDPVELIARTNSILQLAEYHKQIVEQKEKEVAENALLLIKNNKFNISITKKLQQIKCADNENRAIVETIIEEIDTKVKEDGWQRFELAFETVNKNFTKNLLAKHPLLTTSEIKLSIFIKLGMNTKDIATILYKTPDSIKVARYRLRVKLNLSEKQNLTTYLASF
jgi:CheY-like chemotaxis protein/DNA-binding CsgD family transcriptional regulator